MRASDGKQRLTIMAYNRREFLKTTAAITAGVSLSGLPLISCADPAGKKKYGVALYTLRNDLGKDLGGTLQYVSKAGYSQVELFAFDGKTYFGKAPKEFKALLNDSKLIAPSAHFNLPGFLYEGKLDVWKSAVEAAVTMENKYMVVPYIESKYRTPEFYKSMVDQIQKAAELTKAAGMKLAYHNHEFEFEKGPDGKTYFEMLLSQTDPALVDFEMDLYWMTYANQKPVDWFAKYPGRFSMFHLKDLTVAADGKKEFAPVGDGIVDFTSAFAQSKLAGLKYGFVEQDSCKVTPEQCIKKSIDYLKKKNWGNS